MKIVNFKVKNDNPAQPMFSTVGGDKKYTSDAYGNAHRFYLSGSIDAPEKYVEWINTIKNAGPHDVIYLTINCYGGQLYTAIQLRHALELSPAHLIIEVEGACFSAATMFLNIATEFVISPYSTFMFHDYAGGVIGKGSEMFSQITHDRQWSKNLNSKIYKWILTDEELTKITEGVDFYFSADEMVPRLQKFCEAMQNEEENEEDEPKRKSRKKKQSSKSRAS